MRKCAILLLLWGIAFPAMATKIMSIDQMEQLLVKLHGKPDGKVAGELEDAQLTERVSPARLARWEAEFPGKRTQEELLKLADTSAFLILLQAMCCVIRRRISKHSSAWFRWPWIT
jgi:hypothetical protein